MLHKIKIIRLRWIHIMLARQNFYECPPDTHPPTPVHRTCDYEIFTSMLVIFFINLKIGRLPR